MKQDTGALLESILGTLMKRPEPQEAREEPEMMEEVEDVDEATEGLSRRCFRRPTNDDLLRKLNMILALLTNRHYGLCEIKREVREIEENMGNGGIAGGRITTGPFLVRTGENNAISVKVQNLEDSPIDVEIKLLTLESCPAAVLDNASLEDICPCCTEDAVLTAGAGNWEVTVCPTPETAAVRAFVSVHSGNAVTSAIEYVFKASDMLSDACSFCDYVIP